MARRKHAARRRGKAGQPLRTFALASIISFVASSAALHTDLRTTIEPILARLDLALLPAPTSQPNPVAATADGYVQTSFKQCPQFFPSARQVVPAGEALRELCFTSFAILHSGRTKTPVFVAQRLNRRMLVAAQGVERKDRFYEEARLPQRERAKLSDYKGSGHDRGHMAPAGDMPNDDAMAQSFSLANIVPQNAQHNRGAWSKIEADTRKYIMRARGDVYVFTGPVYSRRPETIGQGRVAVPDFLYKIVYDATTERSWVHWQENSADARVGAPISYKEFVRRTGVQLLAPA